MSRPTAPTASGATGVYPEKVPKVWSGSCVDRGAFLGTFAGVTAVR